MTPDALRQIADGMLQLLQADPSQYRTFGPYWPLMKSIMKRFYGRENLALLGDHIDAEAAAHMPPHANLEEAVAAAELTLGEVLDEPEQVDEVNQAAPEAAIESEAGPEPKPLPPPAGLDAGPAEEVNVSERKKCGCGRLLRSTSVGGKCLPCREKEKTHPCRKCGLPILGQRKICDRCADLVTEKPVPVHLPKPSVKVKPAAVQSAPKVVERQKPVARLQGLDLEDLQSEATRDLVAIIKACRAELQRRKDELEAALGEAA